MDRRKILSETFPNKHEVEILILSGHYPQEMPIEEVIFSIKSDDEEKKRKLLDECEHRNSIEFFYQRNVIYSICFVHLFDFTFSENSMSIFCTQETYTMDVHGFRIEKTKINYQEIQKITKSDLKRVSKEDSEKFMIQYRNSFFASFEPLVEKLKLNNHV